MNRFILNIARLNLLRLLWHKLITKHPDEDCYRAFISRMNEKAKAYGMQSTTWINPSGIGENGSYSKTTARDLSILAAIAFKSNRLNDIWNKKEALIHIRKPYIIPWKRNKFKHIQSTVPFSTLEGKYPVLGAKTGSGDGYQSLVMICSIDGRIVSGAIMNTCDESSRFKAMSELMSAVDFKLKGQADSHITSVESADKACAYLIGDHGELTCLYEKHADAVSAPMSTTKVMTLITAFDYIEKTTDWVTVLPFDFHNQAADVLYPWDKITIDGLYYAAMLSSSNIATNVLARIAGESICNL